MITEVSNIQEDMSFHCKAKYKNMHGSGYNLKKIRVGR